MRLSTTRSGGAARGGKCTAAVASRGLAGPGPERSPARERGASCHGRSGPCGSERALARKLRQIALQMRLGTHLRVAEAERQVEANCRCARLSPPETGSTSCTAARVRRGRRLRSKKIIGRRVDAVRTRISCLRPVVPTCCTVALLHKPARQHGRRIFFKPLIQQCADLLSQICSMGQTCEFVALQRVFRCRKQELPRGLGREPGQGKPPCGDRDSDSNAKVILVKINRSSTGCGKLWKSQRPGRLRACSSCAGDYEDPERTAAAVEDEQSEMEKMSTGNQAGDSGDQNE
jgi:hypothetical protein